MTSLTISSSLFTMKCLLAQNHTRTMRLDIPYQGNARTDKQPIPAIVRSKNFSKSLKVALKHARNNEKAYCVIRQYGKISNLPLVNIGTSCQFDLSITF